MGESLSFVVLEHAVLWSVYDRNWHNAVFVLALQALGLLAREYVLALHSLSDRIGIFAWLSRIIARQMLLKFHLDTHPLLFSNQKSPGHQSGAIHATSHRLFYVDNVHPASRSFILDLNHVDRTDYYAGLLRSSAKITLYLNVNSSNQNAPNLTKPAGKDNRNEDLMTWECEVCSYRNTSGLSSAAAEVCGLCGVPRPSPKADSASSALPRRLQAISLSTSLPSSSVDLHTLASSAPASRSDPASITEVACPACTFLNHPSLPSCEICGTALPKVPSRHVAAKSAPSSRPQSDDENEDDMYAPEDGTPRMIKASFRKGGDKAFYAVLRRALLAKAWVVSSSRLL